jgi:hypothetical protein
VRDDRAEFVNRIAGDHGGRALGAFSNLESNS